MNDQPETISAVLAEFRAFALRAAGESAMISPESVLLLADNVEAAAKRERELLMAALVAFVDSIQWLCDGDERGIFKRQFAPLLSNARAALGAGETIRKGVGE